MGVLYHVVGTGFKWVIPTTWYAGDSHARRRRAQNGHITQKCVLLRPVKEVPAKVFLKVFLS